MEYVKLKDITTKITKGTTPSNIGDSFTDEGINYFRSEMLGKAKYLDKSSGMMFISESTHNKLKRSQIEADDILFSMAGIYLGKLAIVKDEDVPANTNQAVALIRFNKDVNIDYLYYFMVQKSFNAYVNCMSAQAAQPNINLKQIGNLQIALPTDEQQKRIAGILSTYDNLIENNNKRIRLLEQMAENLYKEWFVRFRFPGYEDVEFQGKSPKYWNKLRLDQFGIQLESGARPKGGINSFIDDGVPSLGAESVKGLAEFDYSDVKLIPEEFYRKLKRGKNRGNHILIYKDGAYIGKVTLFKYGFPFERFAINEHVFFMNSIRAEYQNYLYFTLKQTSYYTLMQNLNRNAAQPGLSQLDINRIKIIEPDQGTLVSFNDFVEPILKEVFQLAKKNHLLIKQRDMLLPRLMSGKLEV